MKINSILLASLLLLSSCALQKTGGNGKSGIVRIPQFVDEKQGTFLWSHYDASKRGSVMYVKDGKIRVLAENAPDVAFQTINEISAKANVTGQVDAEVLIKTQRAVAELGKRTAAVNMLRDALYRLNEMYYATVDEKSENLNKFLKVDNDSMIINRSLDSINSYSLIQTIDNISLVTLFKNIIDNAKEIAIKEAEADTSIADSESKAFVKKYEESIQKLELQKKLIDKIKDPITKEDLQKFINDNLK